MRTVERAHPNSIPVLYCDLVAATRNDRKFREVHPAMYINLQLGSFRILPCRCTPTCPSMNMLEQMVMAERFRAAPASEEAENDPYRGKMNYAPEKIVLSSQHAEKKPDPSSGGEGD